MQLHKGFKVSRKPCLDMCSFKWLQRRLNLGMYLTPLGSTAIDFNFFISGASCKHLDKEFGIKEYLKQSVLLLKKDLYILAS